MTKPSAPRIIIGIVTSLLLIGLMFQVQGCATNGKQPAPLTPESQQALAELAAWGAGQVICAVKPELAGPLFLASRAVAGEDAAVGALGEWVALLNKNSGLERRIDNVLTILKAEGIIDGEFVPVVAEVTPWVRLVAKAMSEGLATCTGGS